MTQMYALWRKARLQEAPLVLTPAGLLAQDVFEEAHRLHGYWSARFDVIDVADAEDFDTLLPFVPELPWEELTFNLELTTEFLQEAPSPAPGPDELQYLMLKGFVAHLAQLHADFLANRPRHAWCHC